MNRGCIWGGGIPESPESPKLAPNKSTKIMRSNEDENAASPRTCHDLARLVRRPYKLAPLQAKLLATAPWLRQKWVPCGIGCISTCDPETLFLCRASFSDFSSDLSSSHAPMWWPPDDHVFESRSGHSSHCVIPMSRVFTHTCSRST